METKIELKTRARKIVSLLKREYPDPKIALRFSNPLELLIATILSAQCTDERVNVVTPSLFRKYQSAGDFVAASAEDLEKEIMSTGFYRNKTKSIKQCCQLLVEKHGGRVPETMEELLELGGVGRKTANVVLGNAFGIPGISVDTHVKRLSQRLGLTDNSDPDKIEFHLNEIVPTEDWIQFSHLLMAHGRKVCHARRPNCPECCVRRSCPSRED
jgi:endonuclease-3